MRAVFLVGLAAPSLAAPRGSLLRGRSPSWAALVCFLAVSCVPTGDFDAGHEPPPDSGEPVPDASVPDAGTGWTVAVFAGNGASGAADGPPGTARFNDPRGLAININGYLFVADRGNRAARMIDPMGNVSTLQGAGRFYGPEGIAVDRAGKVYVADTKDQCVYELDSSGPVALAGRCRFGDAGFFQCTDIGPGSVGSPTDATLGTPGGMVVDVDAGLLYIADAYNELIRFIPLGGYRVGTVAGKNGYMALWNGSCGQNYCCGSQGGPVFLGCSAAQNAAFRRPVGLGVAPNGDLWVADRDNCAVRRIADPRGAGCTVSTAVADQNCGAGSQSLNGPCGVAVGPDGTVYASDTANQRVVKIDLNEVPTRRVVDLTRPGEVVSPWGIVTDAQGRIFVVDSGRNQVLVLTKNP